MSEEKEVHFEVYSNGIVHCSVCTDLPVEKVAAYANVHSPSGTRHGWEVIEKRFHTGQTNPCPCDSTEGYIHVLLTC